MELPVTFEVPDSIYAGLMKGTLTRTGGVIQRPEGQIAMWLREASPSPVTPDALGGFGNLLGTAGSVASVLNLGATVAFGTAILVKLRKIDRKLDEISAKIDKLQWTVEVGFANVLSYLETLVKYHEIELIGELKAGAELAWGAQFLEPESPQRVMRTEQALAKIVSASEKLLLHCESEVSRTIEDFRKNDFNQRLTVLNETHIASLHRLRQACAALSLKASIYAEAGDLDAGLKVVQNEGAKLKEMLRSLGNAFLRGRGRIQSDSEVRVNFIYDDLLSKTFVETIKPSRIDLWARRFDPEYPSLDAVLQLIRTDKNIVALNQVYGYDGAKFVPEFADLLDGAWEDVDRLLGRAAEYRYALNKGMTIQEYREMLKVNEVKEGQPLVFFIEEAEAK